jgi:hypothetical protein
MLSILGGLELERDRLVAFEDYRVVHGEVAVV